MFRTRANILIALAIVLTVYAARAQDNGNISDQQTSEKSQKWRIALLGGAGHMLGSTSDEKEAMLQMGFASDDVDDYLKDLKTGYQFSGQVHYMFWQNFGLGFDYNHFNTSAEIAGYVDPGDFSMRYATAEEQVYVNYGGFGLYSQSVFNSGKAKLYSQVSFGLVMYREELNFSEYPVLFTGKSFGGNAELGFEYFIHKNIALGANVTLFQSSITKVDMDNGQTSMEHTLEEKLNLTRLNAGLGLHFYF